MNLWRGMDELPYKELLAAPEYARRYRGRNFPACATCTAREQASEALMTSHLTLRQRHGPAQVRLLLIAESPPWSAAGRAIRHFYNPDSPPPDNLFRATAAALLGEDHTRWRAEEKAAQLARLTAGGFLLLDSAKCPVNRLPSKERREALHACAATVLREELARVPLARDAAICLVVRTTVPPAVVPVLRELKLSHLLTEPTGLPFPGRWAGHRQRFIDRLRAAAAERQMP